MKFILYSFDNLSDYEILKNYTPRSLLVNMSFIHYDLGVDCRITLKWTLKKQCVRSVDQVQVPPIRNQWLILAVDVNQHSIP
jgi:hypothetical protein